MGLWVRCIYMERKKVFCTIRKWDYIGNRRYNPSINNLNKQVTTLHRKLKKIDEVYTTYTIERDKWKNQYHIHTYIEYTDKENLYQKLSKYIGGEIKEMNGTNGTFDSCIGKYGTIWIQEVRDEKQLFRYINKYVNRISKTLV